MRLAPEQIAGIKAAVAACSRRGTRVRLFGSRVDEAQRGGDIDLMVEVPAGRGTFRDELRLLAELHRRIGERKVDVLLVEPGRDLAPMEQIAMRDGVVL